MSIHKVLYALVLIGTTAISSRTLAQRANAQPALSTASDKDCTKAAKTVDKGHPAKKLDPARAFLMYCPKQRAEFYVNSFADLRTSRDTAELSRISLESSQVRDGAIFNAVAAVARDASATVEARIYALTTMERLVSPGAYTPVRMLSTVTAGCAVAVESDAGQQAGTTPFPTDALEQLRTMARQLVANVSTPPLLLSAASCINR